MVDKIKKMIQEKMDLLDGCMSHMSDKSFYNGLKTGLESIMDFISKEENNYMNRIVMVNGEAKVIKAEPNAGVDVWVIISSLKAGLSYEQLMKGFNSLSMEEIKIAEKYYEDNKEEIDALIKKEDEG